MFGFESALDFYQKASCTNKLLHAKIPTFILMARDDPVIGEGAIEEILP